MTIIVSVKINNGIVMAADSAGTMGSGQDYLHARKITNPCEGLPVGAMSTGAGGIGKAAFYYGGHQIGDVAKAGLMESPAHRPIIQMLRGRQLRI